MSGFNFQDDDDPLTTTKIKPEPKEESNPQSFLHEDIDKSKLRVIALKFENKTSWFFALKKPSLLISLYSPPSS